MNSYSYYCYRPVSGGPCAKSCLGLLSLLVSDGRETKSAEKRIRPGAVAGFHDLARQSPWSENFQANHYAAIAAWDATEGANLTAGLAIWQFADMREEDSGGGAPWSGLVPDRNKPDSRNNKGVLDVHHRPKLAFYAVRRVWRKHAPLEW